MNRDAHPSPLMPQKFDAEGSEEKMRYAEGRGIG